MKVDYILQKEKYNSWLDGTMVLVECQSSISVSLEDLADGIDVSSSAEVKTEVIIHSSVHDGTGSPLHGVVQARVDNVLLRGTRHARLKFPRRSDINLATDSAKAALQGVLNRLKEVVVGFPLILKGQATIGDMVQVLEPLKVRDCDTTSIDVHVRDDKDSLGPQDIISLGSDGSIGSLSNDLSLDLVSVAGIDDLLHGGRDENIAFLVHEVVLFPCICIKRG